MPVCALIDLTTKKVVNLIVASIEDAAPENHKLIDITDKFVQIGDDLDYVESISQSVADVAASSGNSSEYA